MFCVSVQSKILANQNLTWSKWVFIPAKMCFFLWQLKIFPLPAPCSVTVSRSALQPISFLPSAKCKVHSNQVISANKHQSGVSKNEQFCFGRLGSPVPPASRFCAKNSDSSWLCLGSGADPQSFFSLSFLVQFKDRCAIAAVHPGSENATWQGMDWLEIRGLRELVHIKLDEKAVADIFKNNFGFDWFFFTKGTEFSKLSSSP